MAHTATTNYPILRTTSRVDGTPIQEFLDTISGKPFGVQTNVSQDGLAVCIDDHLGLSNWGAYVSSYPDFNDYKFNGGDRPSYLPGGCHNTSHADARTLVSITGASGSAWSVVRSAL